MAQPENPSAFPGHVYSEATPYESGMTLRDYFAAKALQALARDLNDVEIERLPTLLDGVAKVSYAYADAMLAARSEATVR